MAQEELLFGDFLYHVAKEELGLEMYGPSKHVPQIKEMLYEKFNFEIPSEEYSNEYLSNLLELAYEKFHK